ncbi:MAG: surface protein [Flavipsychrobacter sp.]|jgi:hypothetical protein|nr:surface protein [Flavipsychrobacter sp.]
MNYHYNAYRHLCLLFFLSFLGITTAQAQNISTVAGVGAAGFSGDGGPATVAQIAYPFSIAADGAGGFYLGSDQWWTTTTGYARVRRVNAAGIITTYAGTGTPGFSGDGGPATAAQIGGSSTTWWWGGGGVASDAVGNLYIADWGNYRIRKVDVSTGIITTYAGNGSSGYTGDGGAATAAALGVSTGGWWGMGITADPSGNLYYYCWGYNKVRRIDAATGIITTYAGNGTAAFAGDGGAATAASFGLLYGIAADGSGNVFLSDWSFKRIRKVNSSGTISTYAGTGTAGFGGDGGPATTTGVAMQNLGCSVDGGGNLYFADYNNQRIRKVDALGIISTVAGTGTWGFSGDGGAATAAKLNWPYNTACDGAGNVYIADYQNIRIRKIHNFNRPLYFTAGASTTLSVCQNSPGDSINIPLSIMDSDMYQYATWIIMSAPSHGSAIAAWGAITPGTVFSPHGCYYKPTAGYVGPDTFIARAFDGFVYDTITVYVTVNPVPGSITGVTSFSTSGYTTLSSTPGGGAWTSGSSGIAAASGTTGVVTGVSAGTATITYTIPATGCIRTTTVNVFPYAGKTIITVAGNGTGGYVGDGVAATATQINLPGDVAFDGSGNMYIADDGNQRIRKVNSSGIISTIAGTTIGFSGDGGAATAAQFNNPTGVAVDNSGNVYVADLNNHRVRKISTSGIITTFAGTGTIGFSGDGGAATAARLSYPRELAFDGNGNLYISDQSNSRIRIVNTSGIISTVAGTGTATYGGDGGAATLAQINLPRGVFVDASGNAYIGDFNNNRIRKINTSGTISTYAGTGVSGFTGDGGPATSGRLNNPWGVGMDALGNMFITDAGVRIRKISGTGIITTLAGTGSNGFSGDACAASTAMMNVATGIFVDGTGAIYFADRSNHRVRKIYDNHPPVFNGGHRQPSSMCQNSVDTVNLLLAVTEVDLNQSLTWAVVTGAINGTVTASYSTTSTGGSITPTGMYYTPTTGFTGVDSFKISVTDCSGGMDTTWIVVTVNPPPAGIAGLPSVCVGLTTLFSSIGTGTWTSSAPAVASVGSASGIISGLSVGVATITFAPGASCFVTKMISVNVSPAAVVGSTSICMGTPTTYTDATTGGVWSGSGPITVGSSSGIVSGTSVGTATVTYTHSGCPAMLAITVNGIPTAILGAAIGVCVGNTLGLVNLTPGGTWSSSASSIGSIDAATGVVTGIAAGIITASYTLPTGCFVTAPVTVEGLPSAIVGPSVMCVGQTVTMTDATPGGVWSSSSIGTTVSSDSLTGAISGLATGTAIISYSLLSGIGCSATMILTVDPAPTPISGASAVCIGQSTLLTNPTTGGTWSTTSSRVSVGSSSGVVTGLSSGTGVIVTYTLPSGCYVTKMMTVSVAPGSIGGSLTICNGLTTLLTCSPAGGTWSSVTPAVAVIGTSGVVLGSSAGTSVISYTAPSGCVSTAVVTVNSSPGAITGTLNACPSSTRTLTAAVSGGTWSSSVPSTAAIGSLSGIVMTGGAPGTTTITYSIGTGCSSTATFTVNPLPGAITGIMTVCQGRTTTVNCTPGSGTWTASGSVTVGASTGVVTGSAAGVGGVTYTLPTGCARSASITVNMLPAAITGPGNACQGQNITLSSTSIGGTWTSSSTSIATIGSTSGIVTGGSSAGTATITYALGTGCYQTKPITVNPLPPNIAGPGSVCELGSITLTNPSGGGTWSTASSAASVGASSGIVSGLAGGTALISYTLSTTGCSATKTVTINSLPVIVGPSALCASATITQSSTPGGIWTSSTPSVATIGSASGVVGGVTTGTTVINYVLPTGCSSTKTITVSTSPGAIVGSNTVCVGLSTALTNPAPGGWWVSSSGAASVGSLSGTVTGMTPGVATITYSLGSGCTRTHTMNVTPSPAAILGTPNICVGTSTLLTDATVGGTWSSSATGIATVTSGGLVNGAAAGTATISYTVGSCAAILPVFVNTAPTPIGGPTQVCIGASITATNGVTGGVWSTTSPAITIGSSTGIVTGASGGSGTITYAIGSCTATRVVTVNGVTPITGPTGVCVGRNITLSSSGGGTWTSGATGVATIGSTSGVLTGMATGSAIITYTLGTGCSTTTTVNVNSAPGTITGILRICGGEQTVLNNTVSGGVWSSSSSIVSVGSLSGIVTAGSSAGTATITYSLGSGCNVSAVVTVNASPAPISGSTQICMSSTTTMSNTTPGGIWTSVGSPIHPSSGLLTGSVVGVTTVSYTLTSGCAATKDVTVNAAAPAITGTSNICVGLTTGLFNPASGGIWSSSSTGVATIGTSGTVTGMSPGVSTITYTLGTGCIATQVVTVNAAPTAITGSPQLCIGSTTVLSNGTPGGTWTSGSTSVATVTGGGVVTGAALGTADISYSVGGCPAVVNITVNPLPSAITGPGKVCVGDNITLANPTAGGTWSSSNPVVAAIGTATGTVTGGFAGTANITYSVGVGCTVSRTITVDPLPASITGSANICLGATATLRDATPGGVWSSGSTSIVTIGSTGIVSGVGAGTSMIRYTLPATGCAATFGLIVVSVAPIEGITNDLCAWGDTMLIRDPDTAGTFSSTLVTVTNIGGGYGIVTGFASGMATVTYTLSGIGCMTTGTVTVNSLPAPISGYDRMCLPQTSLLTNATPGGTWSSSVPSVAPISTSGLVSSLSPGTTTIAYTLPTGCKVDTTVIVYPMPSPIIGIGQVCEGANTTYMDTTIGGWWTSSHPLIAAVGVGSGVVTGMGAGVATVTYSLATSCRVMKTITVNPLPTPYIVTGGGNYCAGGSGLHIGLSGSQNGVNYQLYNGVSTVGTPLPGTGIGIDFGLQTGTGTYTVIGTNPLTTCTKNMSGSTVIGSIPTVTPSVSVSSSAGNPVCIGTPSTFTAAPVNGGSAPAYQWFVNSIPVTGIGDSYSYTPANGDIVKAELTSSATCATPPTVSGDLTMNVLNMFVPSVTITGQPGLTIKTGQWDTLIANVVNGSSSQSYQWYWNGWPVSGVFGNTYINKFSNGDSVRCVVTSTGMCGGFTGQASVTITVLPGGGVGVGTITGNSLVQVVPNPNKGMFSIKGTLSSVADEEVTIEVTNMLGQVIYRQNTIARNGKLDEQVSLGQTVASGMYLLNLKSGSDTKVFHIVIEQ